MNLRAFLRASVVKISLLVFVTTGFQGYLFSQTPPELRSKKAPLFVSKNVKKLSKFLTKDETTEEAKVKQISLWIANNIKYDVKHFVKYKDKIYSPKKVLRRRKAVCQGYSDLFVALCREAKIDAVTVPGYSKSGDYDFGDVFFKPDHGWNIVKADGKWKPLDVTWSAGVLIRKRSMKMWVRKIFHKGNCKDKLKFKKKVSDKWLTRDPKEFYYTHCPSDPTYMLLSKNETVSVYENLFTNSENIAPPTHDSALKYYVNNFDDAAITSKPDERAIMSSIPKGYAEGQNSNEFNERNNEEISIGEYNMADSSYNLIDWSNRDSVYLTKKLNVTIDHVSKALTHLDCRLGDIISEKYLQDWKNENKLQITKDEYEFLSKKVKVELKESQKTRKKIIKLRPKMKSLMRRIKNTERQVKKEEATVSKIKTKNKKHSPEVIKTLMDSVNSIQKQYNSVKKIVSKNDSLAHKLKDEMFKDAAIDHLLRDKICAIVFNAAEDRKEFNDSYDDGIRWPKKKSLVLKTKEDSVILQQWLMKEDSVLRMKEREQKLFLQILKRHKDRRTLLKHLWKDTDDNKYHEMLNADFESTDSLLLWQANFCAAHKLYGRAKKKTYKFLLKALKNEKNLFDYEMSTEQMRYSVVKSDIKYRRTLDKLRTKRKMKMAKKLLAVSNKALKKAGKKK